MLRWVLVVLVKTDNVILSLFFGFYREYSEKSYFLNFGLSSCPKSDFALICHLLLFIVVVNIFEGLWIIVPYQSFSFDP